MKKIFLATLVTVRIMFFSLHNIFRLMIGYRISHLIVTTAIADLIENRPEYIHPSTVIYNVPTSIGTTSLVFGLASLYDETLPSDFMDIDAFVREHVEAIFELGKEYNDQPTCNESIKAYAGKELAGKIESPSPFPCFMRKFISHRLALVHDSVRSVMLSRVMERAMQLDTYSHPFEKIYRESFSSKENVTDETHMVSVNWTSDAVIFSQSSPKITFSIEGASKNEFANFGVMSVYFDWSVLNSAVTERRSLESGIDEHDDLVNGKPVVARRRFEKKHMTTQVSIEENGTISLSCIKEAKQGYLTVSARDHKYMRVEGMESPGRIIWRGVYRICGIVLSVL